MSGPLDSCQEFGWAAMGGVNDRGESGSHPHRHGHSGNINAFITHPATMRLIRRLVAPTMLQFGIRAFFRVSAVGDERARAEFMN